MFHYTSFKMEILQDISFFIGRGTGLQDYGNAVKNFCSTRALNKKQDFSRGEVYKNTVVFKKLMNLFTQCWGGESATSFPLFDHFDPSLNNNEKTLKYDWKFHCQVNPP